MTCSWHNRKSRKTGELWHVAADFPRLPSASGLRAFHMVRRLHSYLSGARLAGFGVHKLVAGLQTPHAGCQPSPWPNSKSDGSWSRRRRSAANGAPLVESARNVILVIRLPAYTLNRTKRLAKSPKLYWGDMGVALHLAGIDEPKGHAWRMWCCTTLWFGATHDSTRQNWLLRTTTGEEVDFVIETQGRLLPVEIKTSAQPRLGDASNLRSFRAEYGEKARSGLLLPPTTTSAGSHPTCWRCLGGG